MIFPVQYFIPGFKSVAHVKAVFTPEHCDDIVAMCDLIAHEQNGYQKGLVGNNNGVGRDDPATRITDLAWLVPTHENDWVHNRISQVVGRVNHDYFQLDLDGFDGFQFSQYEGKESQGGHYDWHIDSHEEPPNPAFHRKLSLSLMLSDPTDYEGGELLLNSRGNPEKSERPQLEKGDMVMFYSFVPHCVKPVTKGVRKTLVSWACGNKFK